jgi:carbonic anhydrase/acetyltransferase-like protein (isoleucine patch superfamily)
MEVPPGVVVAGIPARIRRDVTDEDRTRIAHGWEAYARLRELHRAEAADK